MYARTGLGRHSAAVAGFRMTVGGARWAVGLSAAFRPQPAASADRRHWHLQTCRRWMIACQADDTLHASGFPGLGSTSCAWRAVAVAVRPQVAVKILPPDLLLSQGAELHTFVQVGRGGRVEAYLPAAMSHNGSRERTVVH